jgi:hypothetical protein
MKRPPLQVPIAVRVGSRAMPSSVLITARATAWGARDPGWPPAGALSGAAPRNVPIAWKAQRRGRVIRLLRVWAGAEVEVRIANDLDGLPDGYFLHTSGILTESHARDQYQDDDALWWHLAGGPGDPPPGRAAFYLDRDSFLSARSDGPDGGIWLRLSGVLAQLQRTTDMPVFAAS